jgi:hypothetical protein
MKKIVIILTILSLFASCKDTTNKKVETTLSKEVYSIKQQIIQVIAFKGQQVTGVTVSDSGRIFVNFLRKRKNVTNSVMEIKANNQTRSYPNVAWNSWEIKQPVVDNKFVGVQSVVTFESHLYALDTSSKLFKMSLMHLIFLCLI